MDSPLDQREQHSHEQQQQRGGGVLLPCQQFAKLFPIFASFSHPVAFVANMYVAVVPAPGPVLCNPYKGVPIV